MWRGSKGRASWPLMRPGAMARPRSSKCGKAWLCQEAQGFLAVTCFNAWETDFTNHPFLALSSELTRELESCIETTPIPGFNTFKRAGKKLLRVAIPAIPQLAGSLVPGGGTVVVDTVLSVLSAAVSDKADTNDYLETKEAIAAVSKKHWRSWRAG